MADFVELHDAIFSAPDADTLFSDQSWSCVLAPYGLSFEKGIFEAIKDAATNEGDHEILITSDETIPPHEHVFRLQWEPRDFEEIRCSTALASLRSHVFGMSGTWGVVCAFEDYSVIGGRAEFMGEFAARAGGRERLRDRFLGFSRAEWAVPTQLKERLLAIAGWSQSNSDRSECGADREE